MQAYDPRDALAVSQEKPVRFRDEPAPLAVENDDTADVDLRAQDLDVGFAHGLTERRRREGMGLRSEGDLRRVPAWLIEMSATPSRRRRRATSMAAAHVGQVMPRT